MDFHHEVSMSLRSSTEMKMAGIRSMDGLLDVIPAHAGIQVWSAPN